ncbi:MAG: hypothetical protein COC15_02270 [Legionellales bacterium]|nr:MAG: hypothetical protein COC15_02270 [Legionellales bacterium]
MHYTVVKFNPTKYLWMNIMQLNKLLTTGIILIGCLFSATGSCSEDKKLTLNLVLSSIKAEKTSETRGDELYFSITQYSSEKDAKQELIPTFPTYWLSKNLSQIKNVPIWKTDLALGEEVKLIISLLEKDAPPWELDDHIGSVQLKVSNVDGNLEYMWELPDFKKLPAIDLIDTGLDSEFLMQGHGEYRVKFKLTTK